MACFWTAAMKGGRILTTLRNTNDCLSVKLLLVRGETTPRLHTSFSIEVLPAVLVCVLQLHHHRLLFARIVVVESIVVTPRPASGSLTAYALVSEIASRLTRSQLRLH